MTTSTASATITRKGFIAIATTLMSKRECSRLNAAEPTSSYRFEQVLSNVQRFARWNEEDGIPATFALTAYGITWAVDTGRVNGATHIALKAMSVRELLVLIHQVHTNCANMGEIAAYLMGLNLQPAA